MLTKYFKIILKFFILLLIPILLYFIIAHTLTLFPIQKKNNTTQQLEKVYILYNEMHSDIVIDIDALDKPFKKYLKDVIQNRNGYLAFGWGDRETYLNTPTWNDIKASTTLKALFINTPSVMHVQFYKEINWFKNLKVIKLSKRQKEILIITILKSFDINKNSHKGYGKDDFFYHSLYRYNLINTCNTWTGDRLRDANISVSLWTPFSYNVIDSLLESE